MAKEDDNLQLWFDRLRTMQSCMRQINLDTPEDLKPFYGTTHASLLLTTAQKEQFRSCFFHNTQLFITDDDLTNTGTFHELLDQVYRTLVRAVAGVFLRVAIEDGTAAPTATVTDFLKVSTQTAFPEGKSTEDLCGRLMDDMNGFFPADDAGQAAFRTLLKTAGQVVGALVNSIL
jgi:hypothetical protein